MPIEGFRQVDKDEFYKHIYDNNLNVHPSPQGSWDRERGYLTHWKTPSGEVLMISDHKEYFLKSAVR